jgi:benzodiazapine receptor
MNDRLQPLLVLAATVGMIIFNYLAATGILGGVDTGAISDRYPTRMTPAGYAFSIWGLIYLSCLAFSIYQALPSQNKKFRALRRIYIVSCAANCAWLYFWSREMMTVCLGVILILLGSLAYINLKLKQTETAGEYWFAKLPFGIYFGWVTAATLVNAMIALVYQGIPLGYSTNLAVAFIFIAAILGVLIRLKLTNYFYPLAIAWALTAIAVKQSGQTLIVAAAAVGVIACLIASVSFVMTMPSSETK